MKNSFVKYFGRICFLMVLIITMAYLMPLVYKLMTEGKTNVPFILYSPDKKGFFVIDGGKFLDENRHPIAKKKFESALPLFFYSKLLKEGTMPDSVDGMAVSPVLLNTNNFNESIYPIDVDIVEKPYYLLLNCSGVNLTNAPDFYFSATSSFNVFNIKLNQTDTLLSRKMNMAAIRKGFVFPVKAVYGNKSVKMINMDGNFFVDACNNFFQIKLISDSFSVSTFPFPDSFFRISCFFNFDMRNHELLGLALTPDNQIFVLEHGTNNFIKIPIADYRPNQDVLRFSNNVNHRTFTVIGDTVITQYVYNKSFSEIARYHYPIKRYEQTVAGKIQKYVFPFEISFSSPNRLKVSPAIAFNFASYFGLNLLLSLLYYVLRRSSSGVVKAAVFVYCTGLFGFIALLVIK